MGDAILAESKFWFVFRAMLDGTRKTLIECWTFVAQLRFQGYSEVFLNAGVEFVWYFYIEVKAREICFFFRQGQFSVDVNFASVSKAQNL